MEKGGAPPLPKRLANALRMTISGKHSPTGAEGRLCRTQGYGDIDTIYDVIEQVQNLGNQHGEGCSENVSGYGSVFEINSFHKSGASFSFVFVFQYSKLCRESKFRVIGSRPESLTTRNKI